MQPHGARRRPRARRAGQDEGSFPGSDILRHPSPKEALKKIVEGDPLGLIERSARRLRERAFLLDGERLTLRSMARTAHAAPKYQGAPPLAEWLQDRIDDSIADLINEDRESERSNEPIEGGAELRFTFLTETIGVAPTIARRVCVVFNDLPDDRRQAFWAMVIEGKSLNRYVAEGHGPPEKAHDDLKEAFLALSLLETPRLPEDDFEGDGEDDPEEVPR